MAEANNRGQLNPPPPPPPHTLTHTPIPPQKNPNISACFNFKAAFPAAEPDHIISLQITAMGLSCGRGPGIPTRKWQEWESLCVKCVPLFGNSRRLFFIFNFFLWFFGFFFFFNPTSPEALFSPTLAKINRRGEGRGGGGSKVKLPAGRRHPATCCIQYFL